VPEVLLFIAMKKSKALILLIISLSFSIICTAQTKEAKPSRFFLSAGYGLAGSFFVRSYDEALPFPSSDYKAFFKKKFIGVSNELLIGIHLKKNIDLKFGLQYQRFSRHVQVEDTLSGVGLSLDHQIYHVDNIWFGGINKSYIRKRSLLSFGGGLFYIRPQQQEVEIFTNFVIDRERNYKNSKLNDGGAFAELAYEYKFQPKVNLGMKSQVYFILSGSYFNSAALFPFIKLDF